MNSNQASQSQVVVGDQDDEVDQGCQPESSKDAEGDGIFNDIGNYELGRSPHSESGDHESNGSQADEEDVSRSDPEEVDSDGEPISTSTNRKGKQSMRQVMRQNDESQMEGDISSMSGEEELDSDGEPPSTSTKGKGTEPRQQPAFAHTFKPAKGLSRKDKRAAQKQVVRLGQDKKMEWLDPQGSWVPAVHHNTLRPELIRRMATYGSYEKPRSRGMGQWDVTSFHRDQATWGPSRKEDWPGMPDKLLFRLERKGYPVPSYQVPNWYEQGRLVLDWKNRPVRRFTNIPLTLASNAEPWLMEYLRRQDTRINHRDFRARMPHFRVTAKGYQRALGTTSAVSMALQRFRTEEGFPAWRNRQGSDEIADYIKSLLSKEALAANSTEELPGLTKRQQMDSKKDNKGKYLSRAGDRLLSLETRAARDAAEERRMLKWEAQEKAKVPVRPRRRFPNVEPTRIFDEDESLPDVSDPEPWLQSSPAVHTSRRKRTLATGNDFDNRAEGQAVKRRRAPGNAYLGDAPAQSRSSGHQVTGENPRYVNIPRPLNLPTQPPRPQPQLPSGQPLTHPYRQQISHIHTQQHVSPYHQLNSHLHPPLNSYSQQNSRPYAQQYISPYAPQTANTSLDLFQERPQPSQTSNHAMNRVPSDRNGGLRAAAAAQGYYGDHVPMGMGIPGRRGSGLSEDYRYIRPGNQREIRSVQEALQIARAHFFQITGCEAPSTPTAESYAVQHNLLRQAMVQVWRMVDPIPQLSMLGPWTGGFDNWNNDFVHYEDWDGY